MSNVSEYNWFIKGGRLGLAKVSATNTSVTAVPEGTDVKYSGIRYADHFVENEVSQECEIPKRFHRAIIAYVLMSHFEEEGEDKKATIWRLIWNGYLNDARAQADNMRENGPVNLKGHDF